jgi:CheY-like chemotaxis protein
LIVDDQAINQRVAQLYLDQLGLAYHTVSDGKQAIQALETHAYRLILMDCQMPEMDGLEATRKIRAFESSQKIANPVVIIAMTAHAMEGDRQNCIAAGMNDYLSKPIELKNLKNIIEKYLT